MGNNGAEMLFVAKVLAWRMEQPEIRRVSISFTDYGLYAYLHGKHKTCETCWSKNEGDFEKAVELVERKERETECQTEEVCEDQKSTISSDVEQDGITVGTIV
ncbi:hypothetical protein UFOVP453_17 [uncultured Caudovirales phage]|uniref:Uncharacterized protein n=1 Tax=uncultured Caudovirales phage TaxID=2100421 RepID=A0A6J5MCL8_9CAUD|nr:hypothetical protein UFOVP453_17 [uncultured Caudovirales phage]